MLFTLSYLRSNFALTLGYLNPPSNNQAQEVKEKLPYLDNAFERFKEAHRDYVGKILDENDIIEGQRYLEDKERKVRVFRKQIVDWIINIEHKLLAELLQVDSAVNPEDSISCAGTPIPSGTSKVSKHSSRASSRGGRASSVAAARAKEAARIAELKAEMSMLEKRQTLEEKTFRLQQEELRLNLESEMVKTTAKETVYTAMTSPSLPEVKPLKLETELQDQDPPLTSACTKRSIPGEVHHPAQGVSMDSVPYCQFDYQACTVGEELRKETIGLQRQQTALQFQQSRIMELLAHNQNRNKLPQPRVPVFDGNPIEYRTFVRAFDMRERWRRLADDIMDRQLRPVQFSDFVAFVDREARLPTNPVFGKISDTVRSAPGQRFSGCKTSNRKNLSLLAHVPYQ